VILIFANYLVFDKISGDLKKTVEKSVTVAAKAIDGNMLATIIKQNDSSSSEYNQIINSLLYNARNSMRNIYIFVKKDNKTAQFLMDASPDPADFMEDYEMDDVMLSAFKGSVAAETGITEDKWGSWVKLAMRL